MAGVTQPLFACCSEDMIPTPSSFLSYQPRAKRGGNGQPACCDKWADPGADHVA
jgi:hypothetical protein